LVQFFSQKIEFIFYSKNKSKMKPQRIIATIWPTDNEKEVEIRVNFQYLDPQYHSEYLMAIANAFCKCGYAISNITEFYQSIVLIPKFHMRFVKERVPIESEINVVWHDLTRIRCLTA